MHYLERVSRWLLAHRIVVIVGALIQQDSFAEGDEIVVQDMARHAATLSDKAMSGSVNASSPNHCWSAGLSTRTAPSPAST